MASLSAHLREPGDHGRLPFHADCPVCRQERLHGALSSESVVTRRAQAALATGFVAVSLTAPPATWGQELDTRQEGTAAPQSPTDSPAGESGGPEFNPGGETSLPSEFGDTQPDQALDNGQLETEPEVDPDVHLVPQTEVEQEPPAVEQPPVGPAPTPQPPPSGSPTPGDGDPNASAPTADRPAAPQRRAARTRATEEAAKAGARGLQGERAGAPSNYGSTTPSPETSAPVSSSVEIAQTREAPALKPAPRTAARFHVVRHGESLWSIAKTELAPGASMARVAREVNRLWELNRDRIATGDPDLLMVGTKLRLR